MKITICDIDYRKNKTLVASRYRAGFTNGLKVDLCEGHKDWSSNFKSSDELYQALINLSK